MRCQRPGSPFYEPTPVRHLPRVQGCHPRATRGCQSDGSGARLSSSKEDLIKEILDNATILKEPNPKVSLIACARKTCTLEELQQRDAERGFVTDAEEGFCGTCNALVWVSGQSLRLAPAAALVCMQCLALIG